VFLFLSLVIWWGFLAAVLSLSYLTFSAAKKRKSFGGDFGRMMVMLEVCGSEVSSLLFSFGRRDAHCLLTPLSGGRIETVWKKALVLSEGVHRLLAFIKYIGENETYTTNLPLPLICRKPVIHLFPCLSPSTPAQCLQHVIHTLIFMIPCD
jgi:hypothetical protein